MVMTRIMTVGVLLSIVIVALFCFCTSSELLPTTLTVVLDSNPGGLRH